MLSALKVSKRGNQNEAMTGVSSPWHVCPNCSAPLTSKTTYCEHCGATIGYDSPTLMVGKDLRRDLRRRQITNYAAPPPGTMALYLSGRTAPLIIETAVPITLGRNVPGNPRPTVDLMQYHGGIQGVSRLHAMIRRHEGGYILTDLGSTNGTWLNDEQLPKSESRFLQSGDQIRLGYMTLFVQFPDA